MTVLTSMQRKLLREPEVWREEVVLEKPKCRFPDSVNLEAVPGKAAQAWKPVHASSASGKINNLEILYLRSASNLRSGLSPKMNRFGNFLDY